MMDAGEVDDGLTMMWGFVNYYTRTRIFVATHCSNSSTCGLARPALGWGCCFSIFMDVQSVKIANRFTLECGQCDGYTAFSLQALFY
jgi:hypothetical protein